MSIVVDPSGSDTLTPGEVTSAQFSPSGPCNACLVDEHGKCFTAVCRGCTCRRVPVDGWPHNRQTTGGRQ